MGHIQQLGLIAVPLIFGANCTMAAENLLEKPVREFILHGKRQTESRDHPPATGAPGIEEALRNLAYHSGTPICTESVRQKGGGPPVVPIEIDVKNTTVGAILQRIVAQDRRYVFRERLGVIEVLPAGADQDLNNCLNMVIPKFVADLDWNSTFQSFKCQIERVSHKQLLLPNPARAGVCGGGSWAGMANAPVGIITASFDNERVRDILHKLIVIAGDMAWEAWFKGAKPTCDDLVIEAYRPRNWYLSDEPGPVKFLEVLPSKCTSCHYHGN